MTRWCAFPDAPERFNAAITGATHERRLINFLPSRIFYHNLPPPKAKPRLPVGPVANSFSILAENVLLATGGASYPKTGSVGDGQRFAQALGHRLVPYRPGLIGLETRDEKVTRLAGRRFEDGTAKVFDASGKAVFEYRGEIDCERFGLSGAAIYNAQRFIEHYERDDGRGKWDEGSGMRDEGRGTRDEGRGMRESRLKRRSAE